MLVNFISKCWFYFIEHKKFGKPLRYMLIGGICGMLDLLLLYVFVNYFHIWYLHAAITSFIIVLMIGYSGQKYFTFKNYKENYKEQLAVFFVVAGIGLIMNTFLMFLFVSLMNIWYILASIIVKFIILIWNYFANKNITFRDGTMI